MKNVALNEKLTDAELRVLELLEQGFSNGKIASMSTHTVGSIKNTVHDIIVKLGVENRYEAVKRAKELGYLKGTGPNELAIKRPKLSILRPLEKGSSDTSTSYSNYYGLLLTKFNIPDVDKKIVHREHLIRRLNEATTKKLVVLHAPLGFGKTTLLCDWYSENDYIRKYMAWVSLEESDNDQIIFWRYVISSLQSIDASVGVTALQVLSSPGVPQINAFLTILVNDLAKSHGEFFLVLDDYHLIKEQTIHDGITFLIDHMPPTVHIILVSRYLPSLALPRWRAKGQVLILNAGDLKFSFEDVARFFNELNGLDLSIEDISVLNQYSDGWITCLKFLSQNSTIKEHQDIKRFVESFTESHQEILDYLIYDIVDKMSPDTQQFLFETSILGQFNLELCGYVLDYTYDSVEAILNEILQYNLFVVPLDLHQQWYRYHALIKELFLHKLKEINSEKLFSLHRKACEWYMDHDMLIAAIDHALEIKWFDRVVILINNSALPMIVHGELNLLSSWFSKLPTTIIQSKASLCVYYAATMYVTTKRVPLCLEYINYAESLLASSDDESNDANALNMLYVLKAGIATELNDAPTAISLCNQLLENLPETDSLFRGFVYTLFGWANLLREDTVEAKRAFGESVMYYLRIDNFYSAFYSMGHQANVAIKQGQLNEALSIFDDSFDLAREFSDAASPILGGTYFGLAKVQYEVNDIAISLKNVLEAIERSRRGGITSVLFSSYILLSYIKQAKGDFTGALSVYNKIKKLAKTYNVVPMLHVSVEANKAKIQLMQGDLRGAIKWFSGFEHSLEHVDNHLYEFDYLVAIRVLLKQARYDIALGLLDQLEKRARYAKRIGSLIIILELKALGFYAQKETEAAISTIVEALSYGEAEGYFRSFVDEDQTLSELLVLVKQSEPTVSLAYIEKLIIGLQNAKF